MMNTDHANSCQPMRCGAPGPFRTLIVVTTVMVLLFGTTCAFANDWNRTR